MTWEWMSYEKQSQGSEKLLYFA